MHLSDQYDAQYRKVIIATYNDSVLSLEDLRVNADAHSVFIIDDYQ